MTAVEFTLGYNKRAWVHVTVKDATPEEIETLRQENEAAFDLLRHLDAEERLDFGYESDDDNPTYVQEWDEPAICSPIEEVSE